MMAGPQAMEQLAAMMAAAQAAGQQGQPGESQGSSAPGSESSPMPGQQAQTSPAGSGGNTRGGEATDNVARQDGPLEAGQQGADGTDNRTGDNGQGANVASRDYAQPPWFAKLPAELREAMQIEMQRRPPRAYEERLRRYFQSIE